MDLQTGLHIIALLIGIVACLIGIGAMLKPAFMSDGFGIAVDGKATGYVVALGVRDLFIGAIFLHVYFTANWQTLPFYSSALGVVAVSDFIVVIKNGDKKKAAVHLAGAVVSFLYAGLNYVYR